MSDQIPRGDQARETRIAELAKLVESDPRFAAVRAVSDEVNQIAGEAVDLVGQLM